MKRTLTALLLSAAVLSLAACGGKKEAAPPAGAPQASAPAAGASGTRETVTLRMLAMKQAAYSDASVQAMVKKFQEKNPGIKVDVTFVPYEALHDKIVTDQASGAGEFDVVLVDEIWPAEFAAAGFIRDLSDRLTPEMKEGIVPAVARILEVNGKTYGIPWILDTKFLFYNKDMLAKAGFSAPPKTWDELLEQARAIKQKGIVEYPIIWSWGQAEAVICDYTPLVYSWGGEILAPDGSPRFQSGPALEAVKWMVKTLDEKLTNPNSTSALEEDVRQVFSQGQAAFALNWTYMYALANDPKESKVAGQVGIAPFPAGPAGAYGVSGSMGLSITKSSKHPDEAWKLIEFLTSFENQKEYASESLPIWKKAFDNPDQIKAPRELVEAAKTQFASIRGRPEFVPWYNNFSLKAQVALQNILLKQKTPEAALSELAGQVESLRKS